MNIYVLLLLLLLLLWSGCIDQTQLLPQAPYPNPLHYTTTIPWMMCRRSRDLSNEDGDWGWG